MPVAGPAERPRGIARHRKAASCHDAPQSVCAFSKIASNTGARSPGEELMTCNTSAVAVCCSNASRVSVISRAFSIAMTACAANSRSARSALRKWADFTPMGADVSEESILLAQRYQQNGADTGYLVAVRRIGSPSPGRVPLALGNVDVTLAIHQRACTGWLPHRTAGERALRTPADIMGRDSAKLFPRRSPEQPRSAPHILSPFPGSRRTPARGRRARS